MRPCAVVANLGNGGHGGCRGAGLRLGRGDLGKRGVALLRIGRLLGGLECGSKFARRQLGLDIGVRLLAFGRRSGQHDDRQAREGRQKDTPWATSKAELLRACLRGAQLLSQKAGRGFAIPCSHLQHFQIPPVLPALLQALLSLWIALKENASTKAIFSEKTN